MRYIFFNMKIPIIFLCTFLVISCKKNDKPTDKNQLTVSLEETPTSIEELFSNIKIIPLETTDECFLKKITKIDYYKDCIYILDMLLPAFYVFDKDGKFLRKIGNIGHGPGEYTAICDFLIDKKNETINLLTPFGSIYSYQLNGNFIEEKRLPSHVPNYRNMIYLNDKILLTYSSTTHEENALSLISRDSYELINGFWKRHLLINIFSRFPFHEYNGSLFFSTGIINDVYKITEENISLVYSWNFGKHTTEIEKFKFSENYEKDFNTEYKKLLQQMDSEEYPYFLKRQKQNKMYYHAIVSIGEYEEKELFYNKFTQEYKLFKETKEGIKLNTMFLADKFLLGTIFHSEKDIYLKNIKIIKEKEKEKISLYVEDDNPILAIYEF